MIACLAKNARANVLFGELSKLDPTYRNLGQATIDKKALYRGVLQSLTLDWRMLKLDAQRSPAAYQSLSESCQNLIDTSEKPEAILYWGATNLPFTKGGELPYYIITDGPFDPHDPIYPPLWVPRRWPEKYFELQHKIYTGAECVFTLSEWARQKLLNLHRLAPEKVVKIGWGPLGHTNEPPKQEKDTYFISVGNEWKLKSMDLVAQAGSRLHQENPIIKTVLVGKPNGLQIEPLPGVVQMPYLVPNAEVQALVRDAAGLLIVSSFDASPHVIYEALQYGTPVIGTAVCGIPEAVQAPRGGRVIASPSVDAIYEAMKQVLDGGTELRQSAKQVFDESGGWARVASVIHQKIEGRR